MSDSAIPPVLSPTAAKEPKPVAKPVAKTPFKLRLWPAVIIVAVQILLTNGPRWIGTENPMVMMIGMMFGPMIAVGAIAIWWLFFSRVSWLEGFGMLAFAALCGGLLATFAHPSMGMALIMGALPTATLVAVAWLVISFFMPWSVRRIGLMIAIASTCLFFGLMRFEGVTGAFESNMAWRFEKTAEQKYVASLPKTAKTKASDQPAEEAAAKAALEAVEGDWIGFRGPGGDSVYKGEPISESWSPNPPKLLWKHPVGPAWSSFAVIGKYLYTQEQRDKQEIISAFDVNTGEEIWEFADEARFEEPIAGAGPRATPLFHEGKIYAIGARGNLNCLDAMTGNKIWSKSIVDGSVAGDKPVEVPMWGYSSSPIVVDDLVVALPGKPDKAAVTAFDAKTGEKRWSAAGGEHSYTSAQLATLCGVKQILAFTTVGLIGIEPEGGKVLWTYDWPLKDVVRCVQPYVENDTVLISTYFGHGSRKIKVSKAGDAWKTELVWESKEMKPYFNDLVVTGGHAYGFDGNIFCCLDLATGKRTWKGGRYGAGQVLLLEKQNRLLVLSEQGEVILLEVNPEKRVELAKFQAIEGKTWNHPVVAHGKLFVRNAEEMACFDVHSEK